MRIRVVEVDFVSGSGRVVEYWQVVLHEVAFGAARGVLVADIFVDVAQLEQAGSAQELLVDHSRRLLSDFVTLEVQHPAAGLVLHVLNREPVKLQREHDLLIV